LEEFFKSVKELIGEACLPATPTASKIDIAAMLVFVGGDFNFGGFGGWRSEEDILAFLISHFLGSFFSF